MVVVVVVLGCNHPIKLRSIANDVKNGMCRVCVPPLQNNNPPARELPTERAEKYPVLKGPSVFAPLSKCVSLSCLSGIQLESGRRQVQYLLLPLLCGAAE